MSKQIEINEIDREEIAEQIKQGYTSGHLSDGESRIYWEITINKWKN